MRKQIENYIIDDNCCGIIKEPFSSNEEYAYIKLLDYLCTVYENSSSYVNADEVFHKENFIELERLNSLVANIASLFYEDVIMTAANLKYYVCKLLQTELNALGEDATKQVKCFRCTTTGLTEVMPQVKSYNPCLIACIFNYTEVPSDIQNFLKSTLSKSFVSVHEFFDLIDLYAKTHGIESEDFRDSVLSYLIKGIWEHYDTQGPAYDFKSVVKSVIKKML